MSDAWQCDHCKQFFVGSKWGINGNAYSVEIEGGKYEVRFSLNLEPGVVVPIAEPPSMEAVECPPYLELCRECFSKLVLPKLA